MRNESIAALREKLDKREIGAVELTKEYLAEIEKKDGALESYITVCADEALKAADQMTWVGKMNNIQASAMEIVNSELIYA